MVAIPANFIHLLLVFRRTKKALGILYPRFCSLSCLRGWICCAPLWWLAGFAHFVGGVPSVAKFILQVLVSYIMTLVRGRAAVDEFDNLGNL